MASDLVEELNELARKFADEQSAAQFTGKLTMMEGMFRKYATTPEAKAMLFRGARESLDMFRTFYNSLNQTIAKLQ
jgi:hypothetical protein